MIFLLLAIISSAMISVIMRISTDKNEGKYAPLAMNYLICTLLSAGYAGFGRLFPAHAGLGLTLGLGAISGVLFLAAFLLLQINVQKNGVVFSAVFMKLGLLVPMALSILFFGEIPTWLQGVGFLAAVGAILLMHLQKGAGNARAAGGLILLLLAGGGSDAMAKVFETLGPGELANQFLFYNFLVAFLLCLALVIWKKEKIGRREMLFGALLGIPNFFSTKFLLMALGDLPAVIVYPTFSVGTILVVTVAGLLLFKEKLGKRQALAMSVILLALMLLNI